MKYLVMIMMLLALVFGFTPAVQAFGVTGEEMIGGTESAPPDEYNKLILDKVEAIERNAAAFRKRMEGDKKKNVEGAIPELKRVINDFASEGKQALSDSTAANVDSAAASRENAEAVAKVGAKVDGIDATVRAVGQNIGNQITSNFWLLGIFVLILCAVIIVVNLRALRPTTQRFNTLDGTTAAILVAVNNAEVRDSEILRTVQAINMTVNPPPPPGATP